MGLGSNAVSRGGLFATAFVCLAITGLVVAITESYTSAISLQATALAVTVIAAGMGSAYSVGAGIYDTAVVATALLSTAGIVVAAAILTPIRMPILMGILPILPTLSIATNAMDTFVNMADAMQVVNGLVYLLMVILSLAIIGAFVALAMTTRRGQHRGQPGHGGDRLPAQQHAAHPGGDPGDLQPHLRARSYSPLIWHQHQQQHVHGGWAHGCIAATALAVGMPNASPRATPSVTTSG